jgi:hypothetical protein
MRGTALTGWIEGLICDPRSEPARVGEIGVDAIGLAADALEPSTPPPAPDEG